MKSQRPSLVSAIIILVVAIGIIAYLLMRGNGTMVVNDIEKDVVPTTGWSSEYVRDEKVEESGRGYVITALYPVTTSASVTGYFRTFVDDTIAQFKRDTAWAGELDNAESNSLMLDISYVREKATLTDNYVFQTEMYTGGAHGLQATNTFTFMPDGTPVTVAMLFTNGIEGLRTIAPLVQKELMTREFSQEIWMKEGTVPTEQNYQNFTVTDGAVTFIFDPYQVAPYVAGVQKVTIPISAFQNIANTEVFGN